VTAVRAAAANRSRDATERSARAIHELSRRGGEVNFAAVAAIAGVSRQFLYSHPQLRQQIEQLRAQRHAGLARTTTGERASDESLRARLRAALDDNQRLRQDNAQLREELALAHGQVRELKLERSAGPST
jgi:hypothetical protein